MKLRNQEHCQLMEQFDICCVMSSDNQLHLSSYQSSVITNNSTTSTAALHLEDAIAVIRDIAEGESGLLPEEEAFAPADLMASEEDNENIGSNDFTTTTYSSHVTAIETACTYPTIQDYLTKPPSIELESAQPGTSQQFASPMSVAPYWGEVSPSLDTHQNRYLSTYPASPQSNLAPYSSPYYGRSASVSPSLIAGLSPSSPSYKFQRTVISPYGINSRLSTKNYIFNYPKISRKSRKHFMFSACEYSHIKKVYIWDLNGVLVPHIDQMETSLSSSSGDEVVTPGRTKQAVEKALKVIAESSFFYKDLEAAGLTTIDDHSLDDSGQDLSSYDFTGDGFTTAGGLTRKKSDMSTKEWNRKLSFRCRRIKDIYTRQSANLTGIAVAYRGGSLMWLWITNHKTFLQPREAADELLQSLDADEQWSNLPNDIDIATNHWPAKAISCLNLINSRPDSCSIVISKEPLINMIAKTVVFGLAPYTPINCHYSTAKLGMEKCLKQVTDRYGTGCTFIILSNNPERIESAVKNNNFASWPLSNVSDLCSLQTMLQLGHL